MARWGVAGRIDSAQRKQLVAAGQWEAFLRRRDELKAQGYNPDDARAAACKEVLRRDEVTRQGVGDSETSDEAGVRGLPLLPAAPPLLAGKVAAEPEVVRWVANNIDVREPDEATCPCPFAWSLLRECRETPGFVASFFLPLWAKLIPPRSQLEARWTHRSESDPPTARKVTHPG